MELLDTPRWSMIAVAVIGALAWRRWAPSRPRRVLVLMVSTPDYATKPYVRLAERVNKTYADRHGYDFFHAVRSEPSHGHAVWARIDWLRSLLPRYDYIAYIDGDAVFARHDQSLDRFLVNDVVGCSDHPNGPDVINTGTLIVRNTAWAREFLDDWHRMKPWYLEHFAFEQSALSDLLRASKPRRVTVLPARAFNSVADDVLNGRRDTFVVHFMATDDVTRLQGIHDIDRAVSRKASAF